LEIVGKSTQVERLRDRIGLAAASPLDILIAGESGTGKELLPGQYTGQAGGKREIRSRGLRLTRRQPGRGELLAIGRVLLPGQPKIDRDCWNQLRAESFFWTNSNLPFRLQAKLCGVLQEREVRRLGRQRREVLTYRLWLRRTKIYWRK